MRVKITDHPAGRRQARPRACLRRSGYAVGALTAGRNRKNASAYLAYLATDAAQKIYAKYGFPRASAKELELKPIP